MITYVKDPKYHGRTMYINTNNRFIGDIIALKEVILKYILTHEMVVDPFKRHVFVHVKSLRLHSEKIKANLNKENTHEGGELGFKKYFSNTTKSSKGSTNINR